MTIVKETSQNTRNGWVILREAYQVDDEAYDEKQRMIKYRLAKLKREKIARLTAERTKLIRSIQLYQKQALEVESDRDALTITEYIQYILIPDLRNIEWDLRAMGAL